MPCIRGTGLNDLNIPCANGFVKLKDCNGVCAFAGQHGLAPVTAVEGCIDLIASRVIICDDYSNSIFSLWIDQCQLSEEPV